MSSFSSLGSIPTCVGQPGTLDEFVQFSRVYPHVCGAACYPSGVEKDVSGLSPRVWGSLSGMCIAPSAMGSIPTCVGQPGRFGLY